MKIAFFGDSLTEGSPGIAYVPLLQQRFPDFELFNYGKGGDTVLSLLKRIESITFPSKFDLAFIWVGVNDVFVKVSRIYPLLKILRRQPWAKNHDVFLTHYKKLLYLLASNSGGLFTVSLMFIGEDLDNPWNRELEALNTVIKELSFLQENCEFIDLREIFTEKLAGQSPSPYVPKSFTRIIKDALTFKTSGTVERESLKGGLQWTLDGVHLNQVGARLAADVFAEVIEGKFMR
ncbi:MAG: GDSL-type esterase/lipase family protein [Candidatus Aminicenantes bacterium]|nr:GDSL-type esterase/lipase family protein [Candidatus Aminicenantes bacterium]